MTAAAQSKPAKWQVAFGVTLPALLGVCLFGEPTFKHLSIDATFLPRRDRSATLRSSSAPEVLILRIDSASKRLLGVADHEPISRSNHVALLDRLHEDGAGLVIFDLRFSVPRPEVDGEFAAAIARHGRVILAASCVVESTLSKSGTVITDRRMEVSEELRAASAGVGIIDAPKSQLPRRAGSERSVIRQPPLDLAGCESLPVLAARQLGFGTAATGRAGQLWLNYYGPEQTLPSLSFANALLQEKGFFTNRVVVVGDTTPGGKDRYLTPLSRWGAGDMAGTEIIATALLNLTHADALRRWPLAAELMFLVGVGGALGWGARRVRRAPFAAVGIFVMLSWPILAVGLANQAGLWCNWAVLSWAQVPAALVLNLLWHRATQSVGISAAHIPEASVRIPGHRLHAVIGRGGFGEVWLAQNELLGTFRAVKVVHRSRTGDSRHFDYELRGVKLYEPISRQHPNLAAILQVGQSESADYFYYIMELADDLSGADTLQSDKYVPRTLAADLLARSLQGSAAEQVVSIPAAVDLGVALADALAFLHSQNVVHRDLKPANVVFVGGKPKLGDPGLAAEADRSHPSQPGTLDYMDPLTHGQPTGDVYSLAKLLAQVTGVNQGTPQSTGGITAQSTFIPPMSALPYPRVDDRVARRFEAVLAQACGSLENRFASAAEFRAALAELSSQA